MKRNIGIDALKIVSMFMIVLLHIFGQGGILNTLPQFSTRYNITWFIEIMSLCSVNCFAIISGYLYVNKKYNFKSIISLWFQVIFYSITIIGILRLCFPDRVNYTYITKMLLPTMSHSYWYFTAYFGLYLLIPLLNIILEHCNKKILFNSLFLIIAFTSVGSMFNSNLIWESAGYSTIWLMIMYLIGGYIKKYKTEKRNIKRNLLFFFIFCLINFIIKMIADKYFVGVLYFDRLSWSILHYTSPFLILASIELFLYFEQYKPKFKITNKVIDFLAPTSFGVYLIHTNPAVWELIMKDSFIFCTNHLSFSYIIVVGLSSIFLFMVCSLIDYGRIKFFNMIKVHKTSENINNFITSRLMLKEN